MNPVDITSIVTALVHDLKDDMDDMTLAAALSLAEKVKEKAAEMGVKAVVAVANRGEIPCSYNVWTILILQALISR